MDERRIKKVRYKQNSPNNSASTTNSLTPVTEVDTIMRGCCHKKYLKRAPRFALWTAVTQSRWQETHNEIIKLLL